jgi:hypothetical protein
MWLRYKHKWASGIDRKWLWKYLGENVKDSLVQEFLGQINDEHSWSDKYRGIDYDIVKHPPSDILQDKIKSCEKSLQAYTKHLEYLNNLLVDVKALESFGDVEPHNFF